MQNDEDLDFLRMLCSCQKDENFFWLVKQAPSQALEIFSTKRKSNVFFPIFSETTVSNEVLDAF